MRWHMRRLGRFWERFKIYTWKEELLQNVTALLASVGDLEFLRDAFSVQKETTVLQYALYNRVLSNF